MRARNKLQSLDSYVCVCVRACAEHVFRSRVDDEMTSASRQRCAYESPTL